jgi:hypothetical protein
VRPHQALQLQTPGSLFVRSVRLHPEVLPALEYPFADVYRVVPDGTIKLNLRRQFISTSLAGELVGLYVLDECDVQVVYTDIVLGLIDMRNANANPRSNLIRPKRDLRGARSTKQTVTHGRIAR